MPTLRFRIVFALLMSLTMSVLMTGWVSWLNLGLRPDFLARWLHAFYNAWPPAFVIVLLIAPGVHRASNWLLQRMPAGGGAAS